MGGTSSQWAWWRSAMDGNPLSTSDGAVESGFYRTRASKAGGWIPVAIWRDEAGSFNCRVGTKLQSKMIAQDEAAQKWSFICKHPVKRQDYLSAYETAEWPDGCPTAAPSDGKRANTPADPYEAWRSTIADKTEGAARWLASTLIDDQVKADRARNTQAEILALIKEEIGRAHV